MDLLKENPLGCQSTFAAVAEIIVEFSHQDQHPTTRWISFIKAWENSVGRDDFYRLFSQSTTILFLLRQAGNLNLWYVVAVAFDCFLQREREVHGCCLTTIKTEVWVCAALSSFAFPHFSTDGRRWKEEEPTGQTGPYRPREVLFLSANQQKKCRQKKSK